MKKVVAIVVVALLVLGAAASALSMLLLSGDDDDTPRTADVPSVQKDGTLAPFMDQEIDWVECATNMECGWLRVPLDYSKPDGERINIALAKKLASDQDAKLGSIVVNPGGPGAPGTDFVTQIDFVFGRDLTDVYDVVGFDPRGTGHSAPVDCLDDATLDAYMAADPTPDTPEEVAAAKAMNAEFAQGCREKSGAIVDHVSTVDAARDMDVLRAALGEKTLTYYGASYGTKLGATYAELFPKNVGRFVLDAAMDPDQTNLEASLGQAKGFEQALRSYVADCQKSGSCPLTGDVDSGMKQISDFLDEVDEKPLPGGGDREVSVGQAFYGIVMPLYNKSYWPMLTNALTTGFDGDGKALLQLADLYASREAGGYVNNSMEAIGVINCLDDPSSVPIEKVPEQFAKFDEASPTFGRVFAWGLSSCGEFGFTEARDIDLRAEGAAPIIVTGTTRDPATPYAGAVRMAEQLESGVLITRDGDGHGAYGQGSACVDDAIEAYLVDGKVPADGLSC